MHLVIFTILGIIVFFAGMLFFINRAAEPQIEEPEQIFCTADAMQCPDGTWVGRTGPNCEFVCP